MLLIDFLSWWYSQGWRLRLDKTASRLSAIAKFFSLGTLLTTLFSPWRQTITDVGQNKSINAEFSAMIDNLVSRFVGFFVRIMMLAVGILATAFVASISLVLIIVWPFIPFLPIVSLIVLVGASL